MILKDAWELVKEKRNIVLPNPNFVNSLLNFEKKLYGKNSIEGQ